MAFGLGVILCRNGLLMVKPASVTVPAARWSSAASPPPAPQSDPVLLEARFDIFETGEPDGFNLSERVAVVIGVRMVVADDAPPSIQSASATRGRCQGSFDLPSKTI